MTFNVDDINEMRHTLGWHLEVLIDMLYDSLREEKHGKISPDETDELYNILWRKHQLYIKFAEDETYPDEADSILAKCRYAETDYKEARK